MRIPKTIEATCVSEDELVVEGLISEILSNLNSVAWWDSLADEMFNLVMAEIWNRVDREIEWLKEKDKREVAGHEGEIKEGIKRVVGLEIISKLRQQIFWE